MYFSHKRGSDGVITSVVANTQTNKGGGISGSQACMITNYCFITQILLTTVGCWQGREEKTDNKFELVSPWQPQQDNTFKLTLGGKHGFENYIENKSLYSSGLWLVRGEVQVVTVTCKRGRATSTLSL